MNRLAITTLAALTLAAGVSSPAAAATPLPPLTYARLGQTVTIGGYRVTPIAVLEDSRCPAMVTCVWSGQVRLSLRVAAIRGRERFNGEMTSMQPLQLRRGALQIRITQPQNTRAGSPRPAQYRFGFQFTPRGSQSTRLS
ncbi:MAG: hypothetical protein AB7F98_08050 [Novosphingobium sp.]